jgi:hypothetical protein
MLYYNLLLFLQSGLFSSGFPENLDELLILPMRQYYSLYFGHTDNIP